MFPGCITMSDAVDIDVPNLEGRVTKGNPTVCGGSSTICRGTLDGGIKVAIKSLRVHIQDDVHKRLVRELLVWRELRHPNVVPLLGYLSCPNEPPALVSPWYANGSAIHYLESNPKTDCRALARDVINALIYLHSKPVVHGDLKGENVLVDDQGRARLCGFGTSRFIHETNRTGTGNENSGGTARFMCPELLEDKPRTTATDMWAAGCLIVQLLTDEVPYQDIRVIPSLFFAIMCGKPPSMNGRHKIGGDLWVCIEKCWSRNPDDRPKASDIGVHLLSSTIPEVPIPSSLEMPPPKCEQESFWAGQRLSPSFKFITSDTARRINEEFKSAIAEITKQLSTIPYEDRTWDNLTEKFDACALIKQKGDEVEKHDSYIENSSTATDWSEAGLEQCRTLLCKVRSWVQKLMSDSDVQSTSRIDVESMAAILATTGSAISELEGNSTYKNDYQRSIMEFGVLRYPYANKPHFKVYCIKLFAWAERSDPVPISNGSGISGDFWSRIYVPDEELIDKLEADTWVAADDDDCLDD